MRKDINRRTALQYMGAAVGTVSLGGLFSLAACKPRESSVGKDDGNNAAPADVASPEAPKAQDAPAAPVAKRIVFFFTGTGNCLYVARQLADEPISIPQALKKGELEYRAEEIGIVYPIYAHMPPNMVREFLKKAKLECDYLFAILTYGSRKASAAEICDEIGRQTGHPFDYIATLLMVDNWLPNFDMEKERQLDKKVDENLAKIKADLQSRTHSIESVTDEERQHHADLLQRAPDVFTPEGIRAKAEDWFKVTDRCISCGVCVKICPRHNYSIRTETAEAHGECELCLACVHACHHKAIQLVRGEANPNARYRNPNVKVSDIIKANTAL